MIYPRLLGEAGHVNGEEGHVTSLTSWRAACDISARSFGLPTIYERPLVLASLVHCQVLVHWSYGIKIVELLFVV